MHRASTSSHVFIGVVITLLVMGDSAESAAQDGTWSQIPPPGRSRHAAIHDPIRDRMILVAGVEGGGYPTEVWTASLSGELVWTLLPISGSSPAGREGHTVIYDPPRDRLVLFGGSQNGSTYFNDTWALSLSGTPSWTQLTPSGILPTARVGHSAIHDPDLDRMVVFGGYDTTDRNDVWALNFGGGLTWTQVAPLGTPPPGRYWQTAVYDETGRQMVVFGGLNYDFSVFNDSWALPLSGAETWQPLLPSGPAPGTRYGHAAIFDTVRQRMLVFGGESNAAFKNDVWALALGPSPAWTQLTPAGTLPRGRIGSSAFFDPVRDRMVISGGGHYDTETWALSLGATPAWNSLGPPGGTPLGRMNHTSIIDPANDRMIVCAGAFANCEFPSSIMDVWIYSLADEKWTQQSLAGPRPGARWGHTSIFDPLRNRMILFGGGTTYNINFNDLWTLSLGPTPAWEVMAPAGTIPPARIEHSAVYDPIQDRMLVFGGFPNSHPWTLMNDVWALSLSGTPEWTQIFPTGSLPRARYGHSAIFDPAGNRMLIFAGHWGLTLNDVWALSLSGTPSWSQLTPSGELPPAQVDHSAVLDPLENRMITYGEAAYTSDYGTWVLSLGDVPSWSRLSPAGPSPQSRDDNTAVFDAIRNRMIVFGGDSYDCFSLRHDLWALDFAPTSGVVELPGPQPPRPFHSSDPNPFVSSVTIRFDNVSAGIVRVLVFDTEGRLLRRLSESFLPSGRQSIEWNGCDDRGQPIASGLYFYRIESGGAQFGGRLVKSR